jgi:uncharacterized protein
MPSAPDIEANKKTVQSFLDALSAADTDRILELFDENGTWEVVDRNAPVMGPAELAPAVEGFARMCAEPLAFTVTGVTAEGDRVAVETEAAAKLADGRVYENRVHFIFVLADGRIREGREYVDTAHAAKVLAPG